MSTNFAYEVTPPDERDDASEHEPACTCGANWACEDCWAEWLADQGYTFDSVALGGDTSEAGRTVRLEIVGG